MKRLWFVCLALLFVTGLAVLSTGCEPEHPVNDEEVIEAGNNNDFFDQEIVLAEPGVDNKTVSEALYERSSERNFSAGGLSPQQAGNLLWAAGGVGVDGVSGATRTAPSAGGTYPLDIYLVAGVDMEGMKAGVYRYDYEGHVLLPVAEGDRRDLLAASALDQTFIAEAPAAVVLVAYYERTTGRYGERGERYVHMDAGYASQNIYLMAEELELGTVAVGAFDDVEVADILETDGVPLKIMPVGRVD